MTVSDPLSAAWRKSSRSANGGPNNCVEVACMDRVVLVRDSKSAPAGPVLRISAEAWVGFVEFVAASA